jgi:hypothetical protein
LDDIRAGNPPRNPALLEYLTREFITSGFNSRHVIQLICQSRTYQLSIRPNKWNEDDKPTTHAIARRLPAETLFDAVFKVIGAVPNISGAKPGELATIDRPHHGCRGRFICDAWPSRPPERLRV